MKNKIKLHSSDISFINVCKINGSEVMIHYRNKNYIFYTAVFMKYKDEVVTMPWSHTGVPVELHSFLTMALGRGKQSTSCTGRFTPGKEPQHPLNRRLGGHSGHFGYKKNPFPIRIWTSYHPASKPVIILTMLSWLWYSPEAWMNPNTPKEHSVWPLHVVVQIVTTAY